MQLSRRRFLVWAAAVAAYPFVAAHHRPSHIRGPKRSDGFAGAFQGGAFQGDAFQVGVS